MVDRYKTDQQTLSQGSEAPRDSPLDRAGESASYRCPLVRFCDSFQDALKINSGFRSNVVPRGIAIKIVTACALIKRLQRLLNSDRLSAIRIVKHDPDWRVPGGSNGL